MTLRLKANRRFPSVPVVTDDPVNHTQVLMAVKEALDIGQRRTSDLLNSFVRVEDLIDLGLITIEGNTNSIVGADLSEIADIGDLSGAAVGDFLRFDGSEWVNDDLDLTDITQAMVVQHQAALSISWAQLTGAPPSLDDLFDVDAPAPTDGDVLTWNDASSEWIAAAPTGGGGGSQYLDDLLDVDAPYPVAGDVLTWDGYGWVNQAPEGGGGFIGPDAPPETPDPMDDEFNETTLDPKWTWFDQGGSTAVGANGVMQLRGPIEASTHLRGFEQDHTGPARYRCKLTGINPNSFNLGGIAFRNSANGRFAAFWLHRVGPTISVDYFSNATTYNSSPLSSQVRGNYVAPPSEAYIYGEVEDDGTNLIFRVCASGIDDFYTEVVRVARASFIGTPDKIGFYVNGQHGSTPGRIFIDWFRRVA